MRTPDVEILNSEGVIEPENSHAMPSSFVSFERFDLPISFSRRPPQNEFDTLNIIYIEEGDKEYD